MSTSPDAEAILNLTVMVTVDKESDPACRYTLDAVRRWLNIEPSASALGDLTPDDYERAVRALRNLGWSPGAGSQEVPASRLPLAVEALSAVRRTIEEFIAQPDAPVALAVEWRSALVDIDNAAALVDRMIRAVRVASVPERVYATA